MEHDLRVRFVGIVTVSRTQVGFFSSSFLSIKVKNWIGNYGFLASCRNWKTVSLTELRDADRAYSVAG